MSRARPRLAGFALALLLAAAVLEGCAGGPAARPEGATEASADGAAASRSVAAAPGTAGASVPAGPAPLRPLERLPGTSAAQAASAVVPVQSDGSVDPDEDAVEPGMPFERGGASWYGSRFQGRRTASGERFDLDDRTAAHRSLPFGSLICVRNLVNGRSVLVRVNDRGPASRRRVIDISQAAADELGMVGMGVTQVSLARPESGRMRCE